MLHPPRTENLGELCSNSKSFELEGKRKPNFLRVRYFVKDGVPSVIKVRTPGPHGLRSEIA